MGDFYRAYTRYVENHVGDTGFSLGKDNVILYQGRPVITGDSRISGGVLVMPKKGMEALVIDFRNDGLLTSIYQKAKEFASKDPLYKGKILTRGENKMDLEVLAKHR